MDNLRGPARAAYAQGVWTGSTSPIEPPSAFADGTVKQVNPFSGTEVWTVPGRAHAHPVTGADVRDPRRVKRRGGAFCEERYVETTPESGRWIRSKAGWRYAEAHLEEVLATPAEFRRVPNLFEILSFDFWYLNRIHWEPARTGAPGDLSRHRRRATA